MIMQNKLIDVREKEAAEAYLKFLQAKGAPSKMLYMRSKFLDSFMLALSGRIQTRKEFAYALEEILKATDKEEKNNALSTAREYFPFWMNDIKAIAMFEEYYSLKLEEIEWQPKYKTLKQVTDNIEKESFSARETQSLSAYITAIKNLGASEQVIETRSKLAKIILVRLRDAPIENHVVYRISVDLTLPLFKVKEIKQLYLDVVREFYYFWLNDPDAESKVFG